MLTIWGRLSSVNVQKVVWTAGEVGQSFERIDVGGPFGGLDTPEFGRLNPNRQIPVLQDGELTLWESSAIMRYLAARYGEEQLWEPDPARRAMGERWVDWMLAEFQPVLAPVLFGVVRKLPGHTGPEQIAAAIGRSEAKLAILEAELADSLFLSGERFGVADIAVGCGVHRWLHMPIERAARPAIERWYARIAARSAASLALSLPVT